MTRYYTGVGSRETPEDILDLMRRIARELQQRGYTLRSGGAEGADTAFEEGAIEDMEIWLPWKGFNGRTGNLFPRLEAFDIAEEFHPAWGRLSQGARALHARNVHQVLGSDLNTPSDFLVCWTPGGKAGGGTGQAIRIAYDYNVPVFDLGKGKHVSRELYDFVSRSDDE